jgi:hypothetical protein
MMIPRTFNEGIRPTYAPTVNDEPAKRRAHPRLEPFFNQRATLTRDCYSGSGPIDGASLIPITSALYELADEQHQVANARVRSLDLTMVYAAISPAGALRSTFGQTLDGPVAEIVVRNWGALICLVGAMLIYAAFHPPSRALALVVASVSKLVFIALVFVHGRQFLRYQVGPAVVIDAVMVSLFVAYLISRKPAPQIENHHVET